MFLELHTLNLALSGGGWSTSNRFATGERGQALELVWTWQWNEWHPCQGSDDVQLLVLP